MFLSRGFCNSVTRFPLVLDASTHPRSPRSPIDAVGDDAEAAAHISEAMPEALEELATRLIAAQAFGA